jgi:hypothetical protein
MGNVQEVDSAKQQTAELGNGNARGRGDVRREKEGIAVAHYFVSVKDDIVEIVDDVEKCSVLDSVGSDRKTRSWTNCFLRYDEIRQDSGTAMGRIKYKKKGERN